MKEQVGQWSGLSTLKQAFGLLKNHRELWPLCIVPILLSMIAFVAGYYAFSPVYDWMRDFLPQFDSAKNYETSDSWFIVAIFKLIWIYFLKILSWLTDFFIGIITLVVLYQIGLTILSILASPFNDRIGAKVEQIANPALVVQEEPNIISSIRIAAITESQRLFMFLGVFIPLYLFSFLIPGIGQGVLSVVTPLYTALWLSYDSQVYAMDRRDWPMKKRLAFLMKHPINNLTLGLWMMLMMLIPLLHFLVFPVFVTAGTLTFLKHYGEDLTDPQS